MKLPFKRSFDVPIYRANVCLCVANDIFAERKKLKSVLGKPPDKCDYDALCSEGPNGRFFLFFTPRSMTVETIAHELFHLTHRIIDWTGVRFSPNDHESAALLNGFLHEAILKLLPKKEVIRRIQ